MLSGHLCRCTGYAPIVAAIEDARDVGHKRRGRAVNLAQSLLDACERHPELRGVPRDPLRRAPAARRPASPAASASSRARGSRSSSTTGSRRRSSTGRRQWAGAVCVPLSWRLSEEELAYCIDDAGAALVIRDGDPLPDGPEHAGRARPGRARDLAPPLHVGHDRAAEGRPPLARGRPRRRPRPGAAARLPARRPDARRDAALPHDGHPLAARDAPRRRLLRAAGSLGSGGGAAPDRGASGSRRSTSPPPSSTTSRLASGSPTHDVSSVRALGYAGAAMTSTRRRRAASRPSQPEVFVNHYGSTEVYTFSIGRDQARKPGCAGRPSRQHPAEARAGRRDLRAPLRRRGVRRLLEPARRRREGDPRRLVPHRRHRPSRRRRRPLGRRPARRHDRLGRREHPSGRGRGRPREPPRRARGGGDRRPRRPPRARGSSRSSSATRRAEELDAHCLASPLARFKRPREYRLVASLPKSASGKILRRVLRDESKESA